MEQLRLSVEVCCFQLNDEPHIADALVTKGVAYGSAVPEQIKVRHVCIIYPLKNDC